MTKLDAGLMTSLPASDPGSAAVWGSKRINPRPQSCLCPTWSGCPSNDDDDDDDDHPADSAEEYYRRSMYFPYLNVCFEQLRQKFIVRPATVYELSSLLPATSSTLI